MSTTSFLGIPFSLCIVSRLHAKDSVILTSSTLNESMKSENRTLLEVFIHQVLLYREPVRAALKEILGKQEGQTVLERLLALEEKGGYISDPEILFAVQEA